MQLGDATTAQPVCDELIAFRRELHGPDDPQIAVLEEHRTRIAAALKG